MVALLNSSLFCWWWLLLSDCRHLNRREIDRFPAGVAEMSPACKRALGTLCRRLMADYRRHAVRKVCRYRATGKVVYDEFYPGRSRAILDDIDRASRPTTASPRRNWTSSPTMTGSIADKTRFQNLPAPSASEGS